MCSQQGRSCRLVSELLTGNWALWACMPFVASRLRLHQLGSRLGLGKDGAHAIIRSCLEVCSNSHVVGHIIWAHKLASLHIGQVSSGQGNRTYRLQAMGIRH